MNLKTMTSRDWLWLTVISLPPVGLATFLVVATVAWQSRASMIQPKLLETIPQAWVEAEVPAAAAYADQSSRDATELFRNLTDMAQAVSQEFEPLHTVLRSENEKPQPWYATPQPDARLLRHVEDYLAESQPILRAIPQLGTSGQQIWQPSEFAFQYTFYYLSQLNQLIETALMAAIAQRDAERFFEMAELLRYDQMRLIREDVLLPIIPAAMTVPMWEEDDLQQLEAMTVRFQSIPTQWQTHLREQLLYATPWLLGRDSAEMDDEALKRFSYAPSERLAYLDAHQRWMQVDPTSLTVLDQLQAADSEPSRPTAIDSAIQFPFYRQTPPPRLYWKAERLAEQANQRRVTQVAIALRRYQLQNDRYPDRLQQLVSAGLPAETILDPLGEPFHYETDSDTVTLGNASVNFEGQAMVEGGPLRQLHDVVRKYRAYVFR